MATFFASNTDVTSYLGKQDVVRMEKGNPNSTYIRMRVESNREGQILVRRPDQLLGKPVLQWVAPTATTPEDAVIIRIETIAYAKNGKMEATAIDGVNRWFESVDTAFIAVRRENGIGVETADGTPTAPRTAVIDAFLRMERQNGVQNFHHSTVPLSYAESDEDLACWAQEFLTRLDKNVAPVDHRVPEWTVVDPTTKEKRNIVTAFGMFNLQRKRDADHRKNAKSL